MENYSGDSMLVNFGTGKCPLCGDFGKEIVKKNFRCSKCNISFNDFMIMQFEEIGEYYSKYWN